MTLNLPPFLYIVSLISFLLHCIKTEHIWFNVQNSMSSEVLGISLKFFVNKDYFHCVREETLSQHNLALLSRIRHHHTGSELTKRPIKNTVGTKFHASHKFVLNILFYLIRAGHE